MKALTTEKKTESTTYNRTKSDQDSAGHKHEVGPDFVGSGYHPPERFVPLLAKFSHPANATQQVQLFNQLQMHYGNRYVQRVVSAYKSGNVEGDESKLASEIISKKGSGRPLEPVNQTVPSLFKSGVIQAKLKISQPDDEYEREADRVAEELMRESHSQQNYESRNVQAISQIARKEHSGLEVAPEIEAAIQRKRGGHPLPVTNRAFFEQRFGFDFGQVRVHTDAEADRLSRVLSARAFTTGQDIFFSSRGIRIC